MKVGEFRMVGVDDFTFTLECIRIGKVSSIFKRTYEVNDKIEGEDFIILDSSNRWSDYDEIIMNGDVIRVDGCCQDCANKQFEYENFVEMN